VLRLRSSIVFLCIALVLCVIGLRGARSQSASVRRITNTTEEGVSLNPSLSGDGRRIAFESTKDLAGAGGSGGFRALRATLTPASAAFSQMGMTRAVAPAISQDGARVAFASKDNPFGTNTDGNSEIFFFDGSQLRQVTNTTPANVSLRHVQGNFQPSITDDGRFVAFSSNRDLNGLNGDGNLEIFIYDTVAQTFARLTNTAGTIGATDARISGDGTRVAYIRDSGTLSGSPRDLILQQRTGGVPLVIADNLLNLRMTYGRAISDNGQRVVYSATLETAPGSPQVFLYDAPGNRTRQITTLGAPEDEGDVPLHPTISGNGSRIAFSTRRNVNGGNSDDSVELYGYRIATGQFTRLTTAPSSARTDVVSSLSDDGSLVAFNFPRVLSGPVSTSSNANNCEIYVTSTNAGVPEAELIVLNGASMGNEPATTKAIAPESIAVALGDNLATTNLEAQGVPPLSLGGTTVTVNNRPAQIFSVSPELVTFLVPAATEIGTAQVVVTNPAGTRKSATVATLVAAPGVFTRNGDGRGEGLVRDAQTGQFGPFDPTGGNKRLIVSATGVRHASEVTVTIGGRNVTVEAITPSAQMLGLDEIRILLPADLRGVGTVDLIVRADGRAGNPVMVTISGTPRRDIIINEVLADPPLDLAGDANHDGVRDSSDDEFVELVNSTASDIDISGFQLLTRSSTAAEDTLRHVFAPGTIFPAGTAIVVFGGGSPPSNSPVFGGAQIFTASKNGSASSLSLTNSGGVVTLRESSSALVASLSYGDSTGLDADNDQSLTRSPDITGSFVGHQSAQGSNGHAFSPGTRTDGSPFAATPAIARIQITPASANIGTGSRQQFIARAFNASGQELTGVIFRWQSSATAVATIDENGLATAQSPGTTQLRASARGVTSQPATLTVFFQAQVLTRIEVTPATANAPPGGQQQFTARGLDQNGNEIAGLQFAWSSTNVTVATVDQSGLATALSLGTTQIRATAQSINGSATLNVVTPVLVINEVLADPPGSAATDTVGDANRDGVRSSSNDEFIELVNSSNAALNISGWTVSTRPLDEPAERVRHTFAADSVLPARSAFVVFGGGDFDPNNPAFGCAQVVKASAGRVSLTNTGLTILVRDASGNLFAQFTYGGSTGLNGGSNQSLTRSPDVTGNYVRHTEAAGAGGRAFSPGTKVDGSPFGACQGRLTRVTISPDSASVIINRTTQFTAQAFDQFGQPLTGITFTFASSNTSVATIESVSTNASTGIATATVRGRSLGTAQITARATDGTTTVTSAPATLTVTPVPPRVTRVEVTPATATINRGRTQQFTAKAFNQNTPVNGVTFTWASSNEAIATVNQNGLATGVGTGTVTITATAPDGQGGTVSDTATLTVQVPLVINELLGDVPLDDETTPVVEGDANRDGVRDSGDDEFVELVNNSNAPVDISGVTISDSLNKRFTFPANTMLAAGRAVVVFGGGSPPLNDPAFGGSPVFKASSLGLNDSGDTVEVELPVAGTDVLIVALTYGGDDPPDAPSDRSLTRSPDAEKGTTGGDYVPHTSATNAAGRRFSPGTRTDGSPFGSPPITRIQVTPAAATINVGGTRAFTARAFSNTGGPEVEVLNVSFIWDSSDPAKATVAPTTGAMTTATAARGGSVTIRAQAGGQQGTAALTINFPPIARIDVTPANAKAPVGGTQQFTARAFDANNNEIVGVTFNWTSSNKAVATVDQNGLATAVGLGTTTITATAQGKSDTAKLNVVARTVVINEALADPPDGLAGDANHDGVRDSSDDEFVELVNAQNTAVNISGWSIRTRSLTATSETLRHTFAPSTMLPAMDAIVVFGGGTFDPLDPVFGGAQVVTASTGRLSLTNTGLTIIVRDASGNLVTQFMYGGSTGLSGGSNQSLTRSPDITGNFVLHTAAAGAGGRRYSPGRKADGSFFVPRTGRLTSVDISPDSASVIINRTTQFTAQAFDQFGQPLTGITFTFASSNTSVATIESVSTNASTGIATATVRGRALGTAQITARATDGTTTVTSAPATLTVTPAPPRVTRIEVTPETATINRGATQQFMAQAFNQNTPVNGVTFTWTSSNEAIATVDQNGLARGVGIGTVTITATAPDGIGGTVSDTATLTVQVPLVINEFLSDPPDGDAGDANRDGTRDGTDDEFVELVNNSNAPVDISGVIIADATANRFTVPANTTLAAGRALLVFGGGSPPVNDPNFGGALVLKTGSGGLSLNNSADTINVKLPVAGTDVSITSLTYGSEADTNQSITRSPDITGTLVKHTVALNAAGRVFSPGTRTDGTPFGSPPITRIEVLPAAATINVGETQVFTARAFSNTGGPEVEVQNVSFIWDSSDPTRATVAPTTGQTTTATAISGGSTTISARAGGQQGTASLTINFPPIATIEVTPASATITIGGTKQFTARAFDASHNEITGVTFTWTSTDEAVATVDQNGLATAVGLGTTTITASAQGKSDTATLNVVAPSVVINEALADPPDGLAGDANHDGVRDGSDDEFVELVNSTNAGVDISGWSIRTRSLTGTTETLRHTFAPSTMLPAMDAIVVFGGGAFDPLDPVFGGAQVVSASSGGLSLTNTGLTIIVRDAAGEFVVEFTYGGSTGLNGDSNQSLTRSPDITGNFVLHTAAAGAGGRRYSPGRKVDGSFFVPRTGNLTSVDISPDTASVVEGETTQFTAQAFDHFGQPMTGITITFASSDTNVATVESVMTDPDTGIATATVRGQNTGMAEIRATATDGTTTVMSDPATLTVIAAPPMIMRVEVLPETATINRGATQQFTATAFDENDQTVPGVTFTWASSNVAIATVDQNGLATGVGTGTVTITATAPDGMGGMVSDSAMLTVRVPVVINEILADVPPDDPATTAIEGDANRDGVRSADDDEFIEMLNNSNAPVDISGVVISDSVSNRFTFPANTTLAAGRAVLVFGGGSPPANDPAFGGALVFTTTSLGKNDGGDTITVKLPVGGTDVTIDSVTYGPGEPAPAPSNQSLTRSPDAEIGTTGGAFVAHSSATNAAGRVFSPGTRTDGTPFGSPPITRIEVLPAAATINVGETQVFTARAFSNTGGPEVEVLNVSFIWDSSDPTRATVAPTTGQTTTATGVGGGSAMIRAQAGGQQSAATLTVEVLVESIELTPESTSVIVGNSVTFTATARDGGGNPVPGITFAFSLRDPSPAGAATITGMTSNTVTVRGDAAGSVTVVANYTRPSDSMTFEDTSALTITTSPVAPVPTAGQVIVNEAVVSFATSATQVRNDFLELYNTTAQALDISGLVISFRPPGAGNTPATVTLPGTVGGGTTLIQPNSYFLIVNGPETFGVTADFDAASVGLDFNNTTGGIKIEVNSVKLDGLAYQGGATPPAAPFNTYGEGAIFTFTSGTTNDLIRSPNANDTGDNLNDFRRNGTAASVTPKASNPTLRSSDVDDEQGSLFYQLSVESIQAMIHHRRHW
jgi:uncharacterized protein YjdB